MDMGGEGLFPVHPGPVSLTVTSLLLTVLLLLFGFGAYRFGALPLGGWDERWLLHKVM